MKYLKIREKKHQIERNTIKKLILNFKENSECCGNV